MFKELVFIFLHLHLIQKSDGVKLKINRNISGLIGSNWTSLECSYSKEEFSTKDVVSISAFIESSFHPIAMFFPNWMTTDTTITSSGDYLKDRIRLNIISQSNTDFKAVLTFETLTCADERNYLCSVNYTDENFNAKTSVSEPSYLDVIVPPSVPGNITLLHSSHGDADSTSKAMHGSTLHAGDCITVSCFGDVGNPPGVLQAEKRRTDGKVVKLEAQPNSTDEPTGNCSMLQSRLFATQLTADDNGAVFRCFVRTPLVAVGSLYIETEPINVQYPPRKPFIRVEIIANNSHQLACMSDGNPEPSYQWYTFPDADTNTTDLYVSGQNITVYNVTMPLVFICRVNNTIEGRNYIKETNITILPKGTSVDANVGDNLAAALVFGVVCGIILLIAICGSVLYLLYRKRQRSNIELQRLRNSVQSVFEEQTSKY